MNILPSDVIPAENDFLASISTNILFLTDWGKLQLDYDPRPSYPFLPKPQVHACPCGCSLLRKEAGKRKAAAMAREVSVFLRNMLIIVDYIY